MTTDSRSPAQDVEQANLQFYVALSALDLDSMLALWAHTDSVRCIHPGWEVLEGWDAIKASWEGIFASTDELSVEPALVSVQLFGDLAWVSCIERITAGGHLTFTAATNLFQSTPHGWRMILHHASPQPVEELPASPVH